MFCMYGIETSMNVLNKARQLLALTEESLVKTEVIKQDNPNASLCSSTSIQELFIDESDEKKHARTRYGRILGNGRFGKVFACTYRKEPTDRRGVHCCVKVVHVNKRYMNRELDILCELRQNSHRSIICIIDHYWIRRNNASKYCILMPRYICSLRDFLSGLKSQYEAETYSCLIERMGKGLLGALGHLHRMGIMHRDIKPENIMYDSGCENAVLCDFGSAKQVKRGHTNVSTPYICSRWYRAPELILESSTYDNAIDAWSLGCVLIELATGHVTFREDDNTLMLCKIFKEMGVPDVDTVKSLNPSLDDAMIEFTIGSKKHNKVKTKHAVKRLLHPTTLYSRTFVRYISNCMEYLPEKRVAFVATFFD